MSSTILFLCPHGAAKSVMAAAYFNHLAKRAGLPVVADTAGTEPDNSSSPAVVALLGKEGIDVPDRLPRRVTGDDLAQAQYVISLGCNLDDLDTAPERVEQWLNVPSPSEDLPGARRVILAHVEALITRLTGDSHALA
jgi:arsenate reductase (thioredoxin)